MTQRFIDKAEDLLLNHIAQDGDVYELDKIVDKSINQYMLKASVENLKIYAERIMTFNERLKDESMEEDNKDVYRKGIEIIHEFLKIQLLDGKENSEKTYDETKNIFESHKYIEAPYKVLTSGEDRFKNSSLFGLYYSDLSSLEFNKKFLWNEIKDNEVLSNLFINTYGELNPSEKDLYFDVFLNADDESKLSLVKQHTEITHLALACTKSSDIAIVLKGVIDPDHNKEQIALTTEYLEFSNKKLEQLKCYTDKKDTINWYAELITA